MAVYTLLSSSPGQGDEDAPATSWGPFNANGNDPSRRRRCYRTSEPTDCSVWFVLCACMVSVIASWVHIGAVQPTPPLAKSSQTKLTYPNPYVGLESAVLTEAARPAPIINFPLLLAQINSSDPTAVYVQQPHWNSLFGMIYPEDREFMVSNEVSTITQFRTLDFGMERCVVTLGIPSEEGIEDLPEKTVFRPDGPFTLEIWTLDSDERIDPTALTWANRPPMSDLLATMIVQPGYNLLDSMPFPCPARTFLAFEIRCSTPTCYLRFRQDKKTPRLAFFVTQYNTRYDPRPNEEE
ncbi:hypothetical protein DFH07DRAFT_943075 [Mycena maculata]|uniref:Ubiquitin 3 binding protein But2 C-terminal domain-containing protein n=1 Tax=Mycena maculata TaxID=230809 RepID=A0AAD7IIL0_9AGAR|nr:hypothetical protein DFH07DRAFT_943075 [Mycena maculata]